MSRISVTRRRARGVVLLVLVTLTAAAGAAPRGPATVAPTGPRIPATDERTGGGLSLFAAGVAPLWMDSGDTRRHELGVRFTADAPGRINGVTFYQGTPDAGGSHVGRLWGPDGVPLATGRAVTHGGSGWRYAKFPRPVPVRAGVEYVASYTAPNGRYPVTDGGLAHGYTDPLNRDAPLHVVAGLSGGVANFVPGGFPSADGTGNNYWVDVDFTPTGPAEVRAACSPAVTGHGPVLVVTSAANHYTQYLREILEAEGIPAFASTDSCNLGGAARLADYSTVILGDGVTPSTAQLKVLTDWTAAGGSLVAMRPAPNLAGLFGLQPATGSQQDGYLRIDTHVPPGTGLAADTLQWHGTADLHPAAAGTTVLAALYRNAQTAAGFPAVSLHPVGRGRAVAFSFDLARSVVFTRQGNPAWEGQNRDGSALSVGARSDDQFYGGASYDPKPDYVDYSKIQIPQADEQQRLLVNVLNLGGAPLPRLGYLPKGISAAMVMTGDGHPGSHTAEAFDEFADADPPNCHVAEWTCYRYTAYVYPDSSILTRAQARDYIARGFEVSLHVTTDEFDYNPLTLDQDFFTPQLGQFRRAFPDLPAPDTERIHAVAWSDWASVPEVELRHGIRLDTTYYYWPDYWARNRPAMFTGSGLPQRFAALDGTPIDVYQATTQIPDESGLDFPLHFDTLLDNARKKGYVTVVTANCHLDGKPASDACATAGLESARAHGVPVVTAKQLLQWLDARAATGVDGYRWTAPGTLTFELTTPAHNVQLLIPASSGGRRLHSLTADGIAVATSAVTQSGTGYAAVIGPAAGSYVAEYR